MRYSAVPIPPKSALSPSSMRALVPAISTQCVAGGMSAQGVPQETAEPRPCDSAPELSSDRPLLEQLRSPALSRITTRRQHRLTATDEKRVHITFTPGKSHRVGARRDRASPTDPGLALTEESRRTGHRHRLKR